MLHAPVLQIRLSVGRRALEAAKRVSSMVKTRGSTERASPTEVTPVNEETKEQRVTPEPPKKRQKRNQANIKKAIKAETSEASEPAFTPDEASKATKIKAAKKVKKLLQTAHAEEDLPAIQHKASRIYEQLLGLYDDPPCPLNHDNPFQLLCSVILSSQSTDKKVNETVPPLYKKAPDAVSMARLEVDDIEEHIRRIGLGPQKAKNISKMSKALVEKHGGKVPDTLQELEQLAGVGHKTASVVMAVAFKEPTFPVDTHIYRLGKRWGLTAGNTVEQAEAVIFLSYPCTRPMRAEHWPTETP